MDGGGVGAGVWVMVRTVPLCLVRRWAHRLAVYCWHMGSGQLARASALAVSAC